MFDLGSLNPQQREAVRTTDGPVLILAGAGTGKTRVITTRIAHLIGRGHAPGQILAVTFTNKAAREMLARVNQLVPRARGKGDDPPQRPTICTFHSLCVRVLRRNIERLGYKRNFVIYDQAEQLGLVRRILSQVATSGPKIDPAGLLGALGRVRNGGAQTSGGDDDLTAVARHIRARYESALRACNAVDFDDLILLTLRLFDEHPDALEACRQQYRYVMVDEYQDTNAAQFELMHALTKEHRNLCVVGDDDQSIYGWRGAEIANLLEMERYFPEVKVIKLEQNYRSTRSILEAANALIGNNSRRRAKRLWSQLGEGTPLLLSTFPDEEQEARGVAEEIEFLRQARRIPWSEQAVLFRTNVQARPLETALRQAGIRYHVVGGQSFFDRREVRDFLAYLKLFLNPHDDISLLRVANVPARGLSDVTMERLLAASQERRCSVFDAMRDTEVVAGFLPRTRRCLEEFTGLIQETRADLQSPGPHGESEPLRQWAEAMLDRIGYVEELRRSEKNPETAENRIRNVRELAAGLDRDRGARLSLERRLETFLEEIALDTERETDDSERGDEITLITMHSCKGLEFPHVFIVGLEEGLLPHSRSKVEGTLDEERRLFYVAITRAKVTLRLSHCTARRRYGELLACHPSRFLAELPEHLIERGEAEGSEPVSAEAGKDWFAAMRAGLE